MKRYFEFHEAASARGLPAISGDRTLLTVQHTLPEDGRVVWRFRVPSTAHFAVQPTEEIVLVSDDDAKQALSATTPQADRVALLARLSKGARAFEERLAREGAIPIPGREVNVRNTYLRRWKLGSYQFDEGESSSDDEPGLIVRRGGERVMTITTNAPPEERGGCSKFMNYEVLALKAGGPWWILSWRNAPHCDTLPRLQRIDPE